MKETITALVLLVFAVGAFAISIRSFREKGFLFNNAYLYASRQERRTMDKKPHYRQSAIVFLMAGIALLLNAAAVLFGGGWIYGLEAVLLAVMVVYAICSGVKCRRGEGSAKSPRA